MTLGSDGMITIGVGSSALGQGLETVFAQIAGDALSVPFDRFVSCMARPLWSKRALAPIIRAPW